MAPYIHSKQYKTMDTFEKIIAAILIDIIKAQHHANIYSANLATVYKDPEKLIPPLNPNLVYFPIPNSMIKSFDFSISFNIENLFDMLPPEILEQFNVCFNNIYKILIKHSENSEKKEILKKEFETHFTPKLKQQYLSLMGNSGILHPERQSLFTKAILLALEQYPALMAKNKYDNTLQSEIEQLVNSYIKPYPIENALSQLSIQLKPKNVDEETSTMGAINFKVDMRNYQVGFGENEYKNGDTTDEQSRSRLIS